MGLEILSSSDPGPLELSLTVMEACNVCVLFCFEVMPVMLKAYYWLCTQELLLTLLGKAHVGRVGTGIVSMQSKHPSCSTVAAAQSRQHLKLNLVGCLCLQGCF